MTSHSLWIRLVSLNNELDTDIFFTLSHGISGHTVTQTYRFSSFCDSVSTV